MIFNNIVFILLDQLCLLVLVPQDKDVQRSED